MANGTMPPCTAADAVPAKAAKAKATKTTISAFFTLIPPRCFASSEIYLYGEGALCPHPSLRQHCLLSPLLSLLGHAVHSGVRLWQDGEAEGLTAELHGFGKCTEVDRDMCGYRTRQRSQFWLQVPICEDVLADGQCLPQGTLGPVQVRFRHALIPPFVRCGGGSRLGKRLFGQLDVAKLDSCPRQVSKALATVDVHAFRFKQGQRLLVVRDRTSQVGPMIENESPVEVRRSLQERRQFGMLIQQFQASVDLLKRFVKVTDSAMYLARKEVGLDLLWSGTVEAVNQALCFQETTGRPRLAGSLQGVHPVSRHSLSPFSLISGAGGSNPLYSIFGSSSRGF